MTLIIERDRDMIDLGRKIVKITDVLFVKKCLVILGVSVTRLN